AKLSPTEQTLAWRKLNAKRDYVRFLMASACRFQAPVAMAVMADIALRDQSPDAKGLALVRRQAVWGLGLMGKNIRDFSSLPQDKQATILADLKGESEGATDARSRSAKNALWHLDPANKSGEHLTAMDQVLARCADADDPFLRAEVAAVLTYWDGPLVAPTLHQLSNDDGHGTLIRVTEAD